MGGAYVGLAADEALDARDERLVTEYVAGVTRWRGWLDFLIQQFYRGKFNKMEPTLRQVLRLGLYDLLVLETPPHAALNETVEVAKHVVRPDAARLVNGILRAVLRRKDDLPRPDTGKPAKDLALRYSHPSWMVRRWLAQFGPEETEKLLQWNNQRPVYGVRVNTTKTTLDAVCAQLDAHEIEWEPSAYLDDFIRLPRLQPLIRSGWLEEGLCAVQDEGAGLVVRLLDPQPGETVLDACAAPGGKALYAAERMHDEGRLLAVDVHGGRLELVFDAARRHGLDIVETGVHDLRLLAQRSTPPRADRVLLDAPCSGLGVLAKRADLRWNRTPEEIDELTALQDELLGAAAALVRPGGLLVYSTCTVDQVENHERVQAFLQRNEAFTVESAEGYVPEAVVTPEGYFASFPHRHHIDGAFGVRLRRAETP